MKHAPQSNAAPRWRRLNSWRCSAGATPSSRFSINLTEEQTKIKLIHRYTINNGVKQSTSARYSFSAASCRGLPRPSESSLLMRMKFIFTYAKVCPSATSSAYWVAWKAPPTKLQANFLRWNDTVKRPISPLLASRCYTQTVQPGGLAWSQRTGTSDGKQWGITITSFSFSFIVPYAFDNSQIINIVT